MTKTLPSWRLNWLVSKYRPEGVDKNSGTLWWPVLCDGVLTLVVVPSDGVLHSGTLGWLYPILLYGFWYSMVGVPYNGERHLSVL